MLKALFTSLAIVSQLAVLSHVFADEHIRIASFNIAEFGEGDHPQTRDLSFIARMLVGNDIDLLAIQEVGVTEQAASQVKALQDMMNAEGDASDPDYFFHVTPTSGDERCAVIYRFPIVMDDDVYWLDQDKNPQNPGAGGKTYYRIPVALTFHAGDFDFVVVIVHLTWGKLDRRTAEIASLRDFLTADDAEGDWIVLGDMNRYGKYSPGSSKKAFDQLLADNWKDSYRFPLLEAITDPDDMQVFHASEDAHSTTISSDNDLYDQLIITSGAFKEFGAEEPQFDKHVGVIPFDMKEPFSSIADHNEVKYTVSDHRPIWIRFQIDAGDDD